MKRRECLTMLGALAVGPAAMGRVLPEKRWHHVLCAWDCSEYLERPENPVVDSKSVLCFGSRTYDLNTTEGRLAVLADIGVDLIGIGDP